jgi:hypothetical protein
VEGHLRMMDEIFAEGGFNHGDLSDEQTDDSDMQ